MGGPQASLKAQWGVTDPQVCTAGSSPQAVKFTADFKVSIDIINDCLQYTAANAEEEKHEAMNAKRDKVIQAFQSVVPKIDPDDESKAKPSIAAVLNSAKAVAAEAKALKAATEKSVKTWQSLQDAFDKSVTRVEELEAWQAEAVPDLRKLADEVQNEVNEKKYDDAAAGFKQLLTNLKPVYDEYQKQLAAKAAYEPAWELLKPRLEQALAGQFTDEKTKACQWEISNARMDMENLALDRKDYVSAKERLDKLPALLDKFDKARQEMKALYEKTWACLQKQLPKESRQGSPKEAELEQELNDLCTKVESAAASGDYETALSQIDAVRAKLDELTAEHAAYEKRKKDFEDRLAAMKQALDQVLNTSTEVKEVKAAQDAVKAKKTEAETAGTAGDYEAGLKKLDELDAALKAYQDELAKNPRDCTWVLAVAGRLTIGIQSNYMKAATKINNAAQAYDDALAAHKAALKKVNEKKQLVADVLTGIFFAGLAGAAGGAVGTIVKNNIAKEFEKLAATGAVIDATKDIAKFTVKMASNFGGKAGDPTAGLSGVGGSGVELARKVGNAVNAQGEALLKEVDNLYALVQAHADQCKEDPVRVAGDPSESLGSDPFLKVLGSIADANKKTFAQLLWGQWINAYAYTTTQVCIDDNCRPKMEDNVEGFFAWWGDLTKNIEDQAGEDFGLQARLKAARDEWEKKKDDEN